MGSPHPQPFPRSDGIGEGSSLHRCRFLSSRCQRLGRGMPGGGWEGVLPSQESFFQPSSCPVKWVSISQGLPLLCLRAPDEAENRQALWNQYDSTGQAEGLKEHSRMEGSPSTPPPCLSPEKPTRVSPSPLRGAGRGRKEGVWGRRSYCPQTPISSPLLSPQRGEKGGPGGMRGGNGKPAEALSIQPSGSQPPIV
jgi:hypothetical protein